jgi:hypothetical protein
VSLLVVVLKLLKHKQTVEPEAAAVTQSPTASPTAADPVIVTTVAPTVNRRKTARPSAALPPVPVETQSPTAAPSAVPVLEVCIYLHDCIAVLQPRSCVKKCHMLVIA